MDNLNNKQPEDIFEEVEKKQSNFKEEIPKDTKLPNKEPSRVGETKKKSVNIFLLITRLLIILAIIIAIGFVVLYFWNKFENKNVLIEDEILTETTNTTSTPAVIEEPKEKPLDTDSDGLSDVEEKQLKTKIDNPDSDNDGLSDREEVKVYFTDPLDSDTDKDNIPDGEEVRRGLNPDDPAPGAKLFDLEKEIKALED